MPEVGEYWYCAHGSAEVVRIVAADDEVCTFIVVNSFVRPPFGIHEERLREATIDDFLNDYEPRPDVSQEWLQEGSIWFSRHDINTRVVIEDAVDEDDETVAFRQLLPGGAGAIQRMTRADFTQLHALTDEDDQDHLSDERFWVIGGGICAAFVSRADAQAFLYETCAVLRLAENSLGIYVAHGLAVPRGLPAGVGGAGGSASRGDGMGGSSGAMTVTTDGGGGWPNAQRGVLNFVGADSIVSGVPVRPLEPQPQTLWERLTASDD